MPGENLNDLAAFLTVAREGNFTRAAAKLGVSQSALSQTIRSLETRLGLRLLARTTRSVAPTKPGERLLQTIGPHLAEIEAAIISLNELRERPAGSFRITAGDHAIHSLLWPKLAKFLPNYPDIKVEITIDYGLTDIVTEQYDAGVRFGEQVAKDMIAVRIGPDIRFAVIGAKSYFAERPPPKTPHDLVGHTCINLRLPTHGGIYAWEFEREGRELRAESARGRPTCLQRRFPDPGRRIGGLRACLSAGGHGGALSRKRSSRARARRLAPALVRVPPLLPEPAPSFAGLRAAGRGAALSRPRSRCGFEPMIVPSERKRARIERAHSRPCLRSARTWRVCRVRPTEAL